MVTLTWDLTLSSPVLFQPTELIDVKLNQSIPCGYDADTLDRGVKFVAVSHVKFTIQTNEA